MRFVVRKRRTAPTVIIVALIDVLIVLVIFLLVTTTFKQVPALKLTLPASNTGDLKPGVTDNPPLIVTIGSGDEGLRLGAENMPMTIAQVREEFLARAAKNPNLKVAIRADKAAPWGEVVAVMDAAKAAKITMMSAYTTQAVQP